MPPALKKLATRIVVILVLIFFFMAGSYLAITYVIESGKGRIRETLATVTDAKITQDWKSTAPALNQGTTKLQVVTSREKVEFTRRSEWTPLWIPFPDVVVKASAPIETTYYVELSQPWGFRQSGDTLTVTAPPVKFNTPAIDTAGLKEWVDDGSVFRREGVVQEDLRHSLTSMARDVAKEHLPSVRELAKDSIRRFVEHWLKDRYVDAKTKKVEVAFEQ